MSTIPELTKHARELMHKAVENTKREFAAIRSGRASIHILDIVRVEMRRRAAKMRKIEPAG